MDGTSWLWSSSCGFLDLVNIGPVKFHVPFRKLNWGKSNLRIEPMRIARGQEPTPQILQRGMLSNALHQPLAQPAAAMRFQHKYVADIRNRGEITDHPGEAD